MLSHGAACAVLLQGNLHCNNSGELSVSPGSTSCASARRPVLLRQIKCTAEVTVCSGSTTAGFAALSR